MGLKETECEGVSWIQLTKNRVQGRFLWKR